MLRTVLKQLLHNSMSVVLTLVTLNSCFPIALPYAISTQETITGYYGSDRDYYFSVLHKGTLNHSVISTYTTYSLYRLR